MPPLQLVQASSDTGTRACVLAHVDPPACPEGRGLLVMATLMGTWTCAPHVHSEARWALVDGELHLGVCVQRPSRWELTVRAPLTDATAIALLAAAIGAPVILVIADPNRPAATLALGGLPIVGDSASLRSARLALGAHRCSAEPSAGAPAA